MIVRHIPDWSVVKLPDGRIGVLSTGSHKPSVVVSHNLGIEVNRSTELEVIKYPAELARAYVDSLAYLDEVQQEHDKYLEEAA